jgi:hypothetical protein
MNGISSRVCHFTWLMLVAVYNQSKEHINYKDQPLQLYFKDGKLMNKLYKKLFKRLLHATVVSPKTISGKPTAHIKFIVLLLYICIVL